MKKYYTIGKKLDATSSQTPHKNIAQKNDKNSTLLLAKYSQVGYDLVVPIVLGLFIGLGIDNLFKTKPIGFFVFLLLGVVFSFYQVAQLIKESSHGTYRTTRKYKT